MTVITTLSYGQIFITELADPKDQTTGRYVEIYNAGDADIDLTNYSIQRYTNGKTVPQAPVSLEGTIKAKGFYIVARSGFESFYGFKPNLVLGANGSADSNGDDQIQIIDGDGNVIDIFGVPGEDGTGTCHEFSDGRAERVATVTTGNGGTWNEADWNTWTVSAEITGCSNRHSSSPVNTTDGVFDPGRWIGAPSTGPELSVGDIIITEVMYNPAAVSDEYGEWFEIYNTTDAEINLNGLLIADDNHWNDDGEGFLIDTDLVIQANGFLLFATNGDPATNGNLPTPDYVYNSSLTLGNEGKDGIQLITNNIPIDVVIWDGGNLFPYPSGKSISLRVDKFNSIDNDFGYYWCGASTAYGDGDLGTPGTDNDNCVECVKEGDVIFSEIMRNPIKPEDSREWIELYNTTESEIDLRNFRVVDDNKVGEGFSIKPAEGESLMLPAKGYLVFTNNADEALNGGVTPDYVYDPSLTLGNGTDGLQLYCNANLVDKVIWDDGTTFPNTDGKSMSLKVDKLDFVSNDDGGNWGEVIFTFGDGGYGTPGGPNDQALANEIDEVEGFSIYPNPVINSIFVITFASLGEKEVSLYNVLGSQVFRQAFNSDKLEINTSSLESGMYFVRVVEGRNVSVQKLVVQ
jgi:hypothetical protein